MKVYDAIVIGGGQAGLSMGYFFRRHKIDYLILDDREKAGGAWLGVWDGLKLFSPVQFSSLSGWRMPPAKEEYPGKDEFLDYITQYEKRYNFPILRPVKVINVVKDDQLFRLVTDKGEYYCKALISATGSAQNPFIPEYPGAKLFSGLQIHSSQYKSPEAFKGQKVLIVGGGNSGAQILAEISKVTDTQWVTLKPPHFLPDEIDGRYLFEAATRRFLDPQSSDGKYSLGDIVMLDSVKEARERDVLQARRPFESFYEKGVNWSDGGQEEFDAVIWCTGFKADLAHLAGLNITTNNQIETKYCRSVKEPGLWLVGYGNWTGFASATIYGVGKTARDAASQIVEYLKGQ